MRLTYSRAIVKDVRKIKDQRLIDEIEQVISKIKAAQTLDEIPHTSKMKGHPAAYRIRIGNYRLGYYYENDIVRLARLVKRNDIYKVFP